MHPANEGRYIETSSLIGLVHSQNDPCHLESYWSCLYCAKIAESSTANKKVCGQQILPATIVHLILDTAILVYAHFHCDEIDIWENIRKSIQINSAKI